jgi:hypothetical protein
MPDLENMSGHYFRYGEHRSYPPIFRLHFNIFGEGDRRCRGVMNTEAAASKLSRLPPSTMFEIDGFIQIRRQTLTFHLLFTDREFARDRVVYCTFDGIRLWSHVNRDTDSAHSERGSSTVDQL